MARQIIADVLLGMAAAIVLASTAGLLLMPDAYAKLHYVTPIAVVAPVMVGLAVLAQSGLTEDTMETWLAVLFMAISSPFLAHATVRAARVREHGDWRLRPDPGPDRPDGPARDRT
jgi:multisubunit Na+/H+ antiporter MnhG subunit